jgi:hypothetical protein
MAQRRESGLSFRIEGQRVETRGLVAHDHPELAVLVSARSERDAARALLLSLAADVIVRGHRFVAGEQIPYGGDLLRLETSTLELWERDPASGDFHRGASRLLTTLQEGP